MMTMEPMERMMQDMTLPKFDRHWLVYQESIETDMRQGAAGKAISEYLDQLGYRQTEISPSQVYQRGQAFAGLYHPNPKKQQTIITIDLVSAGQTTVVELTMRVNRFGNVPLRQDFEFWRAEIDGIAQTLHIGYADPRTSDFAAERAMWFSVLVMLGSAGLVAAVLLLMVLGLLLLI